MTLMENQIENLYKRIHQIIDVHNYRVEAKSQRKQCPKCKRKVFTISQPNDHVVSSRLADYRVICVSCDITSLLSSNNVSNEQTLNEFIKAIWAYFKLT